ncbi:hypothetical protein V5F77_03940 [Xanthobacter sp. DSM 24535]|uniref:hypothetical protein n=1 Tax=Roseixanthobacter psychrophilus TaxID=3119917 RepID=UPI00372BEBEB
MSETRTPERTSSRRSLAFVFVLGIACTVGANALLSSARANQPFMDAALASLRAARANLIQAEPNKGGHRDRAIDLVDRAINQVEEGIAFAAGQ